MSNYEPIRIRLKFNKRGDLRYVGHLDLQRLIERALRRTNLPLRYSQGFNPKIKLNLASALPLGQESSSEFLDVWLEELVAPESVAIDLNKALPDGVRILAAELISSQLPSLQDSLRESWFTVRFSGEIDAAKQKVEAVLAQDQIMVTRRAKTIDIKPLILNYSWQNPDIFKIRLSAIPNATGRVDEMLVVAGIDPAIVEIERTAMVFEDAADD